ncbi:helix-turn-helix domain-containing protein [Pseudodesulfovibrio sp. F-1]|uniref:Helix-turn-helix domain-containing protein n=1 Tax=Pseudodesulfovibrio alkaliphilus TaxID=2661613 RepID=A0A7K1KS00_9BACT|nr:AraC family transcriptional regulator [Pseudodesulfovibrio alkaliphilus]MUM78838.1 helix-turn-helix domain-containing protein [Pseudodesulfovibrio alkaliphilus]
MVSASVISSNFSCNDLSTKCHAAQGRKFLVVQKGMGGHQVLNFESRNEGMVGIGFNLGGAIRYKVLQDYNLMIKQAGQGQVYISYYRNCSGVIEYPDNESVSWVGVYIPVDMFQTLLDIPMYDFGFLEESVKVSTFFFECLGHITTGMKIALHQILMCPFTDKTKCLYLESKLLELISYVQYCADGSSDLAQHVASMSLTSNDREKMSQAKEILDENLENPPSIVALARALGVNEFKLKNGFRQVHGITPYKYLAEQRLERACRLLWERRMNVTEAAFSVGYSSLSHFAKIFRAKFGVNPNEYLAQSGGHVEAKVSGERS